MARVYTISSGSVSLSAATAMTVIEIPTSANAPAVITDFDITFNGVTASATPVTAQFCSYTGAGTGTSFTPLKANAEAQALASAIATARVADSVEPTSATVRRTLFIPPTSGLIQQFPLGREPIYVPLSSFYGLRLTAPAAVSVCVNLEYEE